MTKTRLFVFAVLLSFALGTSALAVAQEVAQDNESVRTPEQPVAQQQPAPAQPAIFHPQGTVIIPESSVVHPEDAGVRMHTNYQIFVPAGQKGLSTPVPNNTFAEYTASLACVYGVGTAYAGCTPGVINSAYNATGGWGAIALVDAYDDPNAASDLAFFSSTFALPAANFKTVIANSSFGTLNGMTASCSGTPANANLHGWDVEESLDIEWSHAMAPKAQIILVEACSNSGNDLYFAEQVAGKEVAAYGGGDISNSFGSGEFAGEVGTTDDVFYRYHWSHTSYFASAGDSGWGAGYPSSSPWVVSAGGTTVNRDVNGNFLNESCWSGSGGGVSAFELFQSPPNISNGMGPWTNYQYPFASTGARQTPDMSFDADPASGVYVYDSDNSSPGFYIVGGTSVASPSLAGIVNASNQRAGQALPQGGQYEAREDNLIYGEYDLHLTYPKYFYDVTTGCNGTGHCAAVNYDQCTGIGSPRGHTGK